MTETSGQLGASGRHLWDGRHGPYRPTPGFEQRISHRLHTDRDDRLDPITFEVLSTKLWNINEEHADTVQKVSGSPVVVEGYDFNTALTIENGDPFVFAPYNQLFGSAAEFTVKYTLENRPRAIRDGDVFIHNDCLIAGTHQMDVGVYAPVFVRGEIFCWVFNACHARDIGGSEPGGFCVHAMDRYAEAPTLRAALIADSLGWREDVEDTYLGASRTPDLLALELRSQMAGVVRARQRVEELCDTFSARTVKATMYKLIDDSERVCRGRLQNVPDGRWRDEIYVGGAFAGDTDLHRTVLTLEKRGDRLTFSNAGTDRQIGSLNCGYGVWRAAIGCALGHMLAYDHKYCLAGVLRCCSFDAEVGTITCADRDGAYSTIYGQTISLFMAEKVIGKMLFPDPTQRTSILATSGLSSAGWMTHWGPDQWTGAMTATVTLDHGAAGLGAFPLKDGVDQGGTTLWPKSEIPDVEAWERYFPVLYLYRRAARNAGHGKFRGGNGISFALIGHGDQDQAWSAINMTPSTTTQSGLFGGHWGATSLYYGVTDSNIRELFSEGTMPASQQELAELSGTGGRVPAKTMGMRLGRRDVAAKAVFGGGGYGDALEREPDAVAQDLYDDVISLRTAADVYGVVIDEGIVDVDATRTRRATMRRSLLERAVMPATASARTVVAVADGLQIAEVLTVVAHLGRPTIACLNCESALCDIRENYKDHCARVDSALTEVNPEEYVDPSEDGLEHTGLGYRAYLCPHCGVCFERELAPARAAPVWDIAITEASLERFLRPAR